jgi:methoxymalonate biosynthesis acyl carrier protein
MHTDTIRAFVTRHIRNANVRDDDDVFAAGFVNSLFALQLVTFLEREFQITIDNEDLELKNFASIRAMGDFIDRKRAAAAI